jgi:hypothetical protein
LADKDFKVKSGLDLGTPLPLTEGGTGQTSANNALNALLPLQTSSANKVLQTDGTSTSWVTLPNGFTKGNTAARPGSPSLGDIYSNTETGYIEVYISAGWSPLGIIPLAAATPTAVDAGTNVAYGSGAAAVSFTPSSSGGLASSFTATSSPGSITGTGASSPVTVTGLTLGTSYTFTVISSNGYGNSLATSPSNSITTTSVPQAPTIGTATDSATAAGGTVSLTFTAGATGGKTITNYKYSTDGATYTALSPEQTTSPLTISGLTNAVSTTIRLKAVNSNGDSATSSASNSVTPTQFSAIGGTTVTSGGYKYHTFTSSGTFQITSGSKNFQMLVVAGGASGGSQGSAAGGGAGGLRSQTISGTAGSYTVTVGAGGASMYPNPGRGINGSSSSVSGNGMTAYNTTGGGGGANDYGYGQSHGLSGGSGGGEGRSGGTGNYSSSPGAGNAGAYSPSEGNAGGSGAMSNQWYYNDSFQGPVAWGGGGGGAGAVGGNGIGGGAAAQKGGDGGAGSSAYSAWGLATSTGHNVSGTVYYAGGGGANNPGAYGASFTTAVGAGGNGGGAAGGSGPNSTGAGNGTANTGGGGGGGQTYLYTGGAGGSGIVIIRYTV